MATEALRTIEVPTALKSAEEGGEVAMRMQRTKLMAAMLACAALLAMTVLLGSPYAPVVESCPADIEEIWTIEDTRVESEEPLVKKLKNHGSPLAYEEASNTFYCTLGLDFDENWPELHLTAPDAQDVKLMFVDDYSYDRCSDALQDGYSYEVLTYTDTEYYYTRIVFSGLPLVIIECHEEIEDVDVPAQISVSSDANAPVISTGNIHLRGNSSKGSSKKNLKVEFTRSSAGKRRDVDLPEIGIRDDMLLNPMMCDERLVRDRICWELFDQMLGGAYEDGFDSRRMTYAELFLNGEYCGVYLMMEPMEEEKELMKTGMSHLLTDSVYRTIPTKYERGRPLLVHPKSSGRSFELRYEPTDGKKPFAAMETYVDLLVEKDDKIFAEKAAACVDIESAMRYMLLLQSVCLTDNVANNMYIWARKTGDDVRYQFVPWDMDMSWGKAWGGIEDKFGEELNGWYSVDLLDRMIACNAGGAADQIVKLWRGWRDSIFDVNHISALVQGYYTELQESGALMRNNIRWEHETNPEPYEFVDFAEIRFAAVDRAIELIANRNEQFLSKIKRGNVDSKYILIQ